MCENPPRRRRAPSVARRGVLGSALSAAPFPRFLCALARRPSLNVSGLTCSPIPSSASHVRGATRGRLWRGVVKEVWNLTLTAGVSVVRRHSGSQAVQVGGTAIMGTLGARGCWRQDKDGASSSRASMWHWVTNAPAANKRSLVCASWGAAAPESSLRVCATLG